jgi:hypothetical protein
MHLPNKIISNNIVAAPTQTLKAKHSRKTQCYPYSVIPDPVRWNIFRGSIEVSSAKT